MRARVIARAKRLPAARSCLSCWRSSSVKLTRYFLATAGLFSKKTNRSIPPRAKAFRQLFRADRLERASTKQQVQASTTACYTCLLENDNRCNDDRNSVSVISGKVEPIYLLVRQSPGDNHKLTYATYKAR